jgi:hypothetical protein
MYMYGKDVPLTVFLVRPEVLYHVKTHITHLMLIQPWVLQDPQELGLMDKPLVQENLYLDKTEIVIELLLMFPLVFHHQQLQIICIGII